MKNSNSVHLILGTIITGIAITIGYFLYLSTIQKDENVFESRLNVLFEGENTVTDGVKTFLTGTMSKNGREFTLLTGGFTAYEISKESDGFIKKEITAGDLRYSKDEFEYSYGYKFPTYRGEVQSCYDESFELLVKGHKSERKQSYRPNKFVDIKNFPQGYSSTFYSIEMANHPKESYQTANGTGRVYRTDWEVDYFQKQTYYAIIENKEAKSETLMIYLFSSLAAGFLLSLFSKPLAKSLQPNPEATNSIFGKKWKDISNNFIMSFEAGMRGKNITIIVENGKIKKGTMKFTDNGSSLHISLNDSEYYFQITEMTDKTLVVLDLASEKTIQFEVLGSGALTKKQPEIEVLTDLSQDIEVDGSKNPT